MPNIGEIAPDFELLNQDGETVRLSDFRGQRVILFAYPKAATAGCTKQACGLRDSWAAISAANATVIGISPDPPEDLKKWKADEGFPYTLVSDPEHEVLEAWGAWGEKTSFGKTRVGVIRSHWIIGPDGKVEDVQLSISPEKSVERAVQAVENA